MHYLTFKNIGRMFVSPQTEVYEGMIIRSKLT